MRTRMLVMLDWIKRGIFGRDLSKVSTSRRAWCLVLIL